MKKVVLKLDTTDKKVGAKAMKVASCLPGTESIAWDSKEKKMTVIGDVDLVTLVGKLRKICHTEILAVGPAKEPAKKKEEPDADIKEKITKEEPDADIKEKITKEEPDADIKEKITKEERMKYDQYLIT